jgi:hypothetical protein
MPKRPCPRVWPSPPSIRTFVRTHSACNQHFDIGGPQNLSPIDVVAVFEKASGESFEKQFMPESALLAQLEQVNDPLAETFLNSNSSVLTAAS